MRITPVAIAPANCATRCAAPSASFLSDAVFGIGALTIFGFAGRARPLTAARRRPERS